MSFDGLVSGSMKLGPFSDRYMSFSVRLRISGTFILENDFYDSTEFCISGIRAASIGSSPASSVDTVI